MSLLAEDPSCENFGINLKEYTIPIYEVDSLTPTQVVREASTRFHQDPSFRERLFPSRRLWNRHPEQTCTSP